MKCSWGWHHPDNHCPNWNSEFNQCCNYACDLSKPKEKQVTTTDSIIQSRRETHGPFAPQFEFAQLLKGSFRHAPNWGKLSDVQREVLEMEATKLSRILHGNPNEPDHWADLAGYARLAEMHVKGLTDQKDADK